MGNKLQHPGLKRPEMLLCKFPSQCCLGLNGLGKYTYKTRRESFKFWDLVRLILDILR